MQCSYGWQQGEVDEVRSPERSGTLRAGAVDSHVAIYSRVPAVLIIAAFIAGVPVASAQVQRGPTRNPHGTLSIVCENCHTSTSWIPIRPAPDFNHNETRFPLRGLHVEVSCRQCHTKLVFSDVGTKCADCHADIHRRQFGGKCEECHTIRGWRVSMQSVRQHQNRFPLFGAHAAVDCGSCHKNAAAGRFVGLSTDCASCHMRDYQAARVPDHQGAKLPLTCDQCHGLDSWHGAKFDHARFTGFALDGAHRALDCADCHTGNHYAGTPADCFSCHAKDFSGATVPNHVQAGFPRNCATCHNTASWVGAAFDHNRLTRFTLTGAHVNVSCNQCHVAGRYAGTPQDCHSCHIKEFETATNPDHKRGNFPTDCSGCHTTSGWQGAKFNHNLSGFPLTGAHSTLACTSCHLGGVFTLSSGACQSCHLADFNGAKNPNHSAAGFPQDCSVCHTTTSWGGAAFNHNTATTFPLTGAHVNVTCTDCHKNNVFHGLSTACVSCHLADFNNTKSPNHASAGFPQDCSICHTTAKWAGASFDHNRTKFPLTGAHGSLDCQRCHVNGQYAGLSTSCASCHLTDFNNTKNPNHAAAGFPQDCSLCHTTASWTGATFNHNTTTKFPLTGAHANVACGTCHKNNVYAGLSTACVACHLADFNDTKNPSHTAAGFPQDCSICHSTSSWANATFNHNSATQFPLTGAHANVACNVCHKNNVFTGLSTTCISCHQADFNGTKNPSHTAAGFPQNCSLCHSTSSWAGATFDHSKTGFVLTGAHASLGCVQCHANNRFSGTPTACSACHLNDFNQTNNPNHAAAGFPKDCSLCHTTSSWANATFNHNTATKFPLTGAHANLVCSTCHKNNVFSGLSAACVSCHLADFNGTSNPNHVAAGFPQDCSVCHSTSSWRGATFDHNKTPFPLTGAHAKVACASCHIGGKYAGTPTDCYSCHSSEYKSTTVPNHAAAGFPTTCQTCHTTTTWSGATFNHTWFPTNHGNAGGLCSTCHTNPSDYAIFTCTNCHTQAQTDNRHGGVRNYVYSSASCYSCHPSGRGG